MRHPLELLSRSAFWAIKPEALLPAIHHLLSRARLADAGVLVVHEWEAAKPSLVGKTGNKTAIIPIEGVLSKDGPGWYGSSYDSIGEAAERAISDPEIKRAIVSVDSPGGEVTGLPETADLLAQLAAAKPLSAIVHGTSASAAYWLTTQAKDIALTPSGEVGSVGVRMMHVDISKMLDDFGYKVTELHSGDFKTEWSPFKPLTEDAVNAMQPRLDAVHADFLNAINRGRGNRASTEIQNQRYGEGRMFSGDDALKHGLVDKLQSKSAFYRAIVPAQEEAATGPAFPIRRAHSVALTGVKS